MVGWNSEELSTELLSEVLEGANQVAEEAGFVIAGGHTVEDPEHMVDPMTGSIPWDYVPDGALSPFDCDPNIASRYIFD